MVHILSINKKNFFLFFLSFFLLPLFAQDVESPQNSSSSQPNQNQFQQLPTGYSDIQLGLSVEEVKSRLKKNAIFGFRGDRDVSLLPTEERILIETSGSSFFERCWFQFYQDKLYAITLNVNKNRMDYYSMFTTFCKNYGKPDSLNPQKSEWKNDTVLVSLEKPLTLKYIDISVYEDLIEKGKELESTESYLRQKFLESF